MNIKQLKEKIENLPDTMEVFVAERKSEFSYGLVNSACVKKLNFSEDPESKTLATENCFVLDEE